MPVACYLAIEHTQTSINQQLTLWKLQHPGPSAGCPWYMAGWCCCGCCGWLGYWLDVYTFLDGSIQALTNLGMGRADGRVTYHRRRKAYGDTFALSGDLVVANPERVNKELLDAPMDRGAFLGVHMLYPHALPKYDDHMSSLVLALPSGRCPMNDGRHATFHQTFQQYLWNDAARERIRADNPVVVRAMREFKEGFDAEKAKCDSGGGGCTPWMVDRFTTRMVHWGLFGIDAGDESSELFQALMWASNPVPAVLQYLQIGGPCLRVLDMASIDQKMATLTETYMHCPALADYEPLESADLSSPSLAIDYNGRPPRKVSKEEFVRSLLPAIIIAGLQGPKALGTLLVTSRLGGAKVGPFSSEEERALPLVPPADFEYPYGDDDKLRLVILEALRLNPAVFETVYRLPEARTVADYAGYGPKVFPKGCPVLLSYVNTGIDEGVFGSTARSWDPYGHAAELEGPSARFNGFNGVGNQGLRLCPGRELSIRILTHMLNAMGGRIS